MAEHVFQDLIDEVDKGRATKKAPGRRSSPTVGELVARVKQRLTGTPERRARTHTWLTRGGPPALLAAVVGAYFALRPMPQPDFAKDNVKRVLTYTLLTDEFNKLPIEKRMELIGELVKRFQTMSAGDSALMAAFAAGVAGKAREQLQENAARVAVDLWDKYAVQYATVPSEQHGAFLDSALVEMTKLFEVVGGQSRDVSDADRLAEIRQNAQRDSDRARQRQSQGMARAQGRMLTFIRDNIAVHQSPTQQARGQLMLRDMTRHLRDGPRP